MKKFKFDLEKVLSVREKELESINLEVTECLHHVKLKEQEIKRLRQDIVMIQDERSKKLAMTMTSQALKPLIFKEESVQLKLDTSQKELIELHEQSKRLLMKRQNKKTEVNSLEKLKERQKNEYDLHALKQEEAFIESLWNRKNDSKR